jgi:hypothetical protein
MAGFVHDAGDLTCQAFDESEVAAGDADDGDEKIRRRWVGVGPTGLSVN